jgi:uncharacterized protein (DUF302 family)
VDQSVASNPFSTRLQLPFEDAIQRTTTELKNEGFGVLTTIDVKATLSEKLDVDFRPYVILGACNPPSAFKALNADIEIGLMLPCNVIVYEDAGDTVVSAINPEVMMGIVQNPELNSVAEHVGAKLQRVIAALGT